MLERIRKKTKKSIRHWFITELGEITGRIHLHGICWGNPDLVKENWKYGFVFQGNMCNEKTVNYVVKYMLKERQRSHGAYRDWETDRKSTRLNSSHITRSRMPSSA